MTELCSGGELAQLISAAGDEGVNLGIARQVPARTLGVNIFAVVARNCAARWSPTMS